MKSCVICGGPLPNQHGNRKYCSDRCRRSQYQGICVDCGSPTRGGDRPGRVPRRCIACDRLTRERSERQTQRWQARRDRVVAMYRDGLTVAEMAAELNSTVGAVAVYIHRLRAYGYDLPYRRAVQHSDDPDLQPAA